MLMAFFELLLWGEPGLIRAEPVSIISGISAVASLAGTVGSLFSKSPKEQKPIAPPNDADRAKGEADQRRRLLAARGFKSTILSDLASQNNSLKQNFGA